jgi:hypothetical protein
MPTNYVLVDFENVQPDLSMLANSAYKVKVFFGAKQQEGRVPFKLFDAMLALGGNVEPIKVMRSGRNAVDMHIAYFVGRLLENEPNAVIHIISGDTDFDPLVEFLTREGIHCKRAKNITEIAKQAQAKARPPAPSRAARKEAAQREARAHHQAAALAFRQARHAQETRAGHRQLLPPSRRAAHRQRHRAADRRADPAQVREPERQQGELSPDLIPPARVRRSERDSRSGGVVVRPFLN